MLGSGTSLAIDVPRPPAVPSPSAQAAAASGPEPAWVAAAARGDRAAFGLLHDRYAPMVHGILLAHLPRTEVDDLVQDVFLRALTGLHGLRNGAAFGPWIATIARNRANDHHRRHRTPLRRAGELPEEVAGPDRPQADPAEAIEAVEALEAIRALPETYREPLLLRLVEGMTGPEISERTGLTPDSVRVNLHRGMKRLRDLLGARPARKDDR